MPKSDFNRPPIYPEDFEWDRDRIQERLREFSYLCAKAGDRRRRLGNDPKYEQSDILRVRNFADKAAAAGCDRNKIGVSVLEKWAAGIVVAKLDGWVPNYNQVDDETEEMGRHLSRDK